MLKNVLLLTFRSIRRHRGHAAINILGLAVGLASCLFIFAFIAGESKFDRFHDGADELYRVNWDFNWQDTEGVSPGTPPPLAARLREEFPEVEATTRIYPVSPTVVRKDDRFFVEKRIRAVDSNFFEMFSFDLLEGSPDAVLSEPNTVVLTRSAALKYFPSGSSVGETLVIGEDESVFGSAYRSLFTVTGIVQDPPPNSHIQFDLLTSMASHPQVAFFDWSWIWMQVATYASVAPGSSIAGLEARVADMVAVHAPSAFQRVGFSYEELISSGGHWNFVFQPLTDVYLESGQIGNRLGPLGDSTYLFVFAVVGVFILLIACINFMNLTTARSSARAREIGIRKVVGSFRGDLVRQFLIEAIVYSLLAMAIAVALVVILRGPFEALAERPMAVSLVEPAWLPLALLGLSLFVGLLSGSYPGLYLSAFKPVDVLKRKAFSGSDGAGVRNSLVVLQFSISIALIIATLVVRSQMDFFLHSEKGFDEAGVVVVSNMNDRLGGQVESFRRELEAMPEVVAASATTGAPPTYGFEDYYKAEGHGETQFNLQSYLVDDHYAEAMGLELVAGRAFSEDFSDSASVILNESAVRQFGWDDPIGRTITYPSAGMYTVVGVLKDFHFMNLRQSIAPFALFHESSRSYRIPDSYVLARLAPGEIGAGIQSLEKKWKTIAPTAPFEYAFLDDRMAVEYASEKRLAQIFLVFSALAILIASLGLFGLATFVTEQRTKEIGLRKTLGASSPSVVFLLSKDFARWVLLANALAWPAAWIGMNRWLDSFAYRVDMGVGQLLAGAAIAFGIALVTVSFKSARASLANPIKALSCE